MKASTRFLAPALLFLLPISLKAQDKQAQTPVFTSGTSFVQVPVIVQRSGKHVGGLRKEDFVLRQDGKDQPIASFEEIHTGMGRVAVAQDQIGNTGSWVPPQITIIAMDMVNTPNLDRTYFMQEFERYLTKSDKFNGPVGVVAIERTGIRVVRGFTKDPRLIMAAFNENSNAQPTNNSQMSQLSKQFSDEIVSQSESELAGGADLVPLPIALKMREADEAMARFQDRSARIDVQLAVQQLAQ